MTHWKLWLPGAAAAALLAAVVGFGLEHEQRDGAHDGALLKDSWRLRLVSEDVAEDVAERAYGAELMRLSRDGKLDGDPYLLELIGSVMEPLIGAAADLYPDSAEWNWEWHVAQSREANAFCMTGGRIMVLSGLMADSLLGEDRDMLATILAHEVAHALLEHTREKIGRAWTAQTLSWVVGKSLKVGGLRSGKLDEGFRLALLNPKERAQETEADVLGLELMTRAGFDPRKAVTTWQRFSSRTNDGQSTRRAFEFLFDHPADANRMEKLAALQAQAAPLAHKAAERRVRWQLRDLDPAHASVLSTASGAFGLDDPGLRVAPESDLAESVGKRAGMAPGVAAAVLDDALMRAARSSQGPLPVGQLVMVRAMGGWDRVERFAAAWRHGGGRAPLVDDPAGLDKLELSGDDRLYARAALQHVQTYLDSPRFRYRLLQRTGIELRQISAEAAEAFDGWLETLLQGESK